MNVLRHSHGVVLELLLSGKYRVYYENYGYLCSRDFDDFRKAKGFYAHRVAIVSQLKLNLS